MKTFKTFLNEATPTSKTDKPPTQVDKARDRQNREKEELRVRQARELAKAREDDFRKKESERRQKEAQKAAALSAKKNQQNEESSESENQNPAEYVPEYLEDGTLVLVKTYKANTPGQ